MPSFYWIKLYHEILDDPKMGKLSDRLWRRTIELFLLAGDADKNGELPKLDDIAWRLRLSPEFLESDLVELAKVGIVSHSEGRYSVTNFIKRQTAASNAERQAQYRERLRKEEYYNNEGVTGRYTDIDKNRIDIDKEEDKEQNAAAAAFGKLCKVYEAEIGSLTPAISDELDALISEYEYTWIMDAIKETRLNNVRNLKYTVAILKNWKAKGYKGGKKKKELSAMSAEERTKYYELPDYLAQP